MNDREGIQSVIVSPQRRKDRKEKANVDASIFFNETRGAWVYF